MTARRSPCHLAWRQQRGDVVRAARAVVRCARRQRGAALHGLLLQVSHAFAAALRQRDAACQHAPEAFGHHVAGHAAFDGEEARPVRVVLAEDFTDACTDDPRSDLPFQEVALLFDHDHTFETLGEFAEEPAVGWAKQSDLGQPDAVRFESSRVEPEVLEGLQGVGPTLARADDADPIPR